MVILIKKYILDRIEYFCCFYEFCMREKKRVLRTLSSFSFTLYIAWIDLPVNEFEVEKKKKKKTIARDSRLYCGRNSTFFNGQYHLSVLFVSATNQVWLSRIRPLTDCWWHYPLLTFNLSRFASLECRLVVEQSLSAFDETITRKSRKKKLVLGIIN